MSDDTQLPPLDTDPDEWDEYWDEPTTITVDRWVKAHLDHQRDGQPWNEYLEALRRQKSDPLTFSEVEGIADHLQNELELMIMGVDDELADDLDDLRESVRAIEERLGGIETAVEGLGR